MPLCIYVPITITNNGQTENWSIQYKSLDQKSYYCRLWKILLSVFEAFGVTDEEEKHQLLIGFESLLTNVSKFWLENVLIPVSMEIDIPTTTKCNCNYVQNGYRRCLHDIVSFSHYQKDGTFPVKVDLFAGPPYISINTACQKDADIARFKRYYIHMVQRHQVSPCCSCCPISKDFIHELEDFMKETRVTIQDMIKDLVPSSESDSSHKDDD